MLKFALPLKKNMSERLFGLIGYPLEHSFSQSYFSNKFQNEKIKNCSYKLFPIHSIDELPDVIKGNPGLVGLNVTIPYKREVLKHLDNVDPVAKRIGAVNTIKIKRSLLYGYNSDVYGFRESLYKFLGPAFKGKALVLGTGGASKAVNHVLEEMGIPKTSVSRFKKKDVITYDEVTGQVVSDHYLIINTTPLGMEPNIETFPELPYSSITSSHYLYDLVYNPAQTAFLEKGKSMKAKTSNGMAMLILQAECSWKIWNQ
jgi:shikimate dehydrogenase